MVMHVINPMADKTVMVPRVTTFTVMTWWWRLWRHDGSRDDWRRRVVFDGVPAFGKVRVDAGE
jgi:hypothetical protein